MTAKIYNPWDKIIIKDLQVGEYYWMKWSIDKDKSDTISYKVFTIRNVRGYYYQIKENDYYISDEMVSHHLTDDPIQTGSLVVCIISNWFAVHHIKVGNAYKVISNFWDGLIQLEWVPDRMSKERFSTFKIPCDSSADEVVSTPLADESQLTIWSRVRLRKHTIYSHQNDGFGTVTDINYYSSLPIIVTWDKNKKGGITNSYQSEHLELAPLDIEFVPSDLPKAQYIWGSDPTLTTGKVYYFTGIHENDIAVIDDRGTKNLEDIKLFKILGRISQYSPIQKGTRVRCISNDYLKLKFGEYYTVDIYASHNSPGFKIMGSYYRKEDFCYTGDLDNDTSVSESEDIRRFSIGECVRIYAPGTSHHTMRGKVIWYNKEKKEYGIKCQNTVWFYPDPNLESDSLWTEYTSPVLQEVISPSNNTSMQNNFDNVPGFIQDVLNDEYFTKAKIKEIASLVKTGKKCSKDIQEQMKLLDNTENKIVDAINILLLASSRKDIEGVENALTVIKDLNEKTEELTVSIIKD